MFDRALKLNLEHFIAPSLGGSDKSSNLVTACEECNAKKNSSVPSQELRNRISEAIKKNNEEFKSLFGLEIPFEVEGTYEDSIEITKPFCSKEDCGAEMVLKKSREGIFFWGCSRHPVCAGNRNIGNPMQGQLKDYLW